MVTTSGYYTVPMTVPQAASVRKGPGEQSIRYVKGVGPQRLTQLARLGIETVEDACYAAPLRYEDRTHLLPIAEVRPGQTVTVRGRVVARALRRIRGGRTILDVAFGDGSGVLYGVWFNQPYLAQQLQVDQEYVLYGQVESKPRLQMIHPELEQIEEDSQGSWHVGRIVPIYSLTGGVGQRWLRQLIGTAVEQSAELLEDTLPQEIRLQHGWPTLPEAVRALHFPATWEALEAAQQRLAFDELFLFQLALAQRRAQTVGRTKPHRYQLEGPLLSRFLEGLPFHLTASQRRVLDELLHELGRPHPMYRLLQGDVGCGKTVVLMALMAAAVQSGYQVALMAPTELLAEQHARVVQDYLGPLGVAVGLFTQALAPADRRRQAQALAEGKLSVAIGTHALIQTAIQFKRLALAIIDEQHKFGVVQRAHLAKKADDPDVLVVTATPIPRTLALSLYGDLEVSTISELPKGRQPIVTRWLRELERPALYSLIRQELSQGRQAYVVYPLVNEGSASELRPSRRRRGSIGARGRSDRAASQMAKRLQAEVFAEFRVGLLHGQMKPAVKERTMRAFARGDVQLLVSTVIVEVGLDVPNATLMAIEHPERFGLAQLHQLRGRIGRGAHAATCVVISDAVDESVAQRLGAFVQTSNGFELAEKDLELRGPGELLGRRQHGWLRFRIANLARDQGLLELAREHAQALIGQDAALQAPSLAVLRRRLAELRGQRG
ncbi:MAG: ATP-dependent DNA helicase RecG [Candidatus Omnitrophica bacterium CG11_big_fil_rev_8_21_14_0_20_63_9]|nr:MAG: ATP-dependent DNA helicase RecG [Candidatus Omnitrophica bacterium CG11_big_fil_rev_8_21_14_0_20_63_9]